MIDLFGLGKNQDPPEEEAPATTVPVSAIATPHAAGERTRGSRRLWAFLLVLDSVFVIVFAGAVAAKVYQHWNTPAAQAVARTRRPVAGRGAKEQAKTAETPAASTAPIASAPKPAATPSADDRAAAPRPPKPSLLSDAPKHRETPRLAAASAKATPDQRPAGALRAPDTSAAVKVKALRAEFKLHAPKARSVDLLGAFIVRGGRREMTRQDDGTWTLTLYLNPGRYRYFFSVDKKRQLDPENPHSEKGASLLTVP